MTLPQMLKSKFIQLPHITLHALEGGHGQPMVFLHGFPEFSGMWKIQLEYFSKHFHVIAPDLRGYNLSDKPIAVEEYQILKLIKDIKSLLESLPKPAILVAHDWGGIIAQVTAALHPHLIAKLVILNAPHPALYQHQIRTSKAQQQAAEYTLLLRSPIAEKILARNDFAFLKKIIGDRRENILDEYKKAWAQNDAINVMTNYYRTSNLPMIDNKTPDWQNFEFMPGLDVEKLKISVPSLIIWGEQDQALCIENLDGIDHYFSDLTIKRLSNCGHFLVSERPHEINQIIEKFIT